MISYKFYIQNYYRSGFYKIQALFSVATCKHFNCFQIRLKLIQRVPLRKIRFFKRIEEKGRQFFERVMGNAYLFRLIVINKMLPATINIIQLIRVLLSSGAKDASFDGFARAF